MKMRERHNWIIEPFLHHSEKWIENPLTDLRLIPGTPLFNMIVEFDSHDPENIPIQLWEELVKNEWIIPGETEILTRFNLKIISLEGTAHCNQRCTFCPVSDHPKGVHVMDLHFYESIVQQLVAYKDTIEGVFMINYNEPTLDPYFIDRIALLHKYNLPICINTNASGLTPKRIDQIQQMGIIRFLSINLSSVDPDFYENERNYKGLDKILRNVAYAGQFNLAQEMHIAVLGHNDSVHRNNFSAVKDKFQDSTFEVVSHTITNRAGHIATGIRVDDPVNHLAGCDLMGSRPIQHLHINSFGQCFLCCQDYFEDYKFGDLSREALEEVLVGPEIQRLRAMIYGIDEAPEDFICRHCVFALSCNQKR